MTETQEKALALVKAHGGLYGLALEAAIEQHEAFRQEVSDVCEGLLACTNANKRYGASLVLNRFIIAKPDPLVEALQEWGGSGKGAVDAAALRAVLAARGLEIREKRND